MLNQRLVNRRSAWRALRTHYRKIERSTISQLFSDDPQRAEHMSLTQGDLYLDYSKNRLTMETIDLLVELAKECGLPEKIRAMFEGKKINHSEHRAALHTALRLPIGESVYLDQKNLMPEIQQGLMQMRLLSDQIRGGRMAGYTGRKIKNIINIGIGGSDLGPVMAFEALRFYSDRALCFRFISNVDSSDFIEATRDLNPEESLFIVCSKSFTTTETLSNALLAKSWLLEKLTHPEAVGQHFIAVSGNEHGVAEFGIDISKMLIVWDWVGGRYSIDSAVGLSTMIAIGAERFYELLYGMHEMDDHFLHVALKQNMPVLLGLIAIWNNNFLKINSVAVIPYSHYLRRFPAYLQQLTMESNGKHVDVNGKALTFNTCPVYWGEPGTNGQHSFYQFLHQGTALVASDFIGFCKPLHEQITQHNILMANCFAQAEALAYGQSAEQLRHAQVPADLVLHQVCSGNRPSNTILAKTLTPGSLGQLIALYEHSVFTQGAIWNINSFDQWGVELGKQMAKEMTQELQESLNQAIPDSLHNGSTRKLMQYYCAHRDS
ncbi:glucose-6-phosphate isomerase [Undibacterium jejuense]|uniref:Glucose-6-phosphate isomerase n=1 Tax=Undibacterium jejuense TaxID=1344949 RepID=A0A923HKG5_9BURK|nr:glucose-6-phosphate isomerase [Undibacterium jejuense]MBC3863387.1 glucose-6-phosphate isomerase [Undibacterium jejuense]